MNEGIKPRIDNGSVIEYSFRLRKKDKKRKSVRLHSSINNMVLPAPTFESDVSEEEENTDVRTVQIPLNIINEVHTCEDKLECKFLLISLLSLVFSLLFMCVFL